MTINELIEKVGWISPAAAAYLSGDAKELESYHCDESGNSVISIMVWSETPQGHDFWSDIHDIVGY